MTSDTDTQLRYYNSTVNMLAREVARTFGGTVKRNVDDDLYENVACVKVAAFGEVPGYELTLDRRSFGAAAHKLTVRVGPLGGVNPDVYMESLKALSASFDSRRETQSLLADIGRRVVNAPATRAALIEYEARLKALQARRRGIEGHVKELLAAAPNAMLARDGVSNYEARIFSRSGVSFNARVGAEGRVSFNRIGTVSADAARRILAILAEPGADGDSKSQAEG